MAKTKSADLEPISTSLLEKLQEIAQVERVEPKALMSNDSAEATDAEANTLALLHGDGFANADAAFQSLFAIFGIRRYSDKKLLAMDRTPFFVQRIVQRIGGSPTGEDDWAIEIVTSDGEPQVLTLGMNGGRDKFLYTAAIILRQYGSNKNPFVLDFLPLKDPLKEGFYLISPLIVTEPRKATPVVVTYDEV